MIKSVHILLSLIYVLVTAYLKAEIEILLVQLYLCVVNLRARVYYADDS